MDVSIFLRMNKKILTPETTIYFCNFQLKNKTNDNATPIISNYFVIDQKTFKIFIDFLNNFSDDYPKSITIKTNKFYHDKYIKSRNDLLEFGLLTPKEEELDLRKIIILNPRCCISTISEYVWQTIYKFRFNSSDPTISNFVENKYKRYKR